MQPQLAAQRLDQRLERTVGMIGGTATLEHFVAGGYELVLEFAHQARLADAGVADDAQQAQGAGLRRREVFLQRLQFAPAADKRRHARRGQRGVGGIGRGRLRDAECAVASLGLIEALQPPHLLQRLPAEAVSDDAPRRLADHQRSRCGDRLQPCRQVDGGADRLAVTDDHLAGADADADAEPEREHCVDDLQAGTHRLHRRVLARDRKTEVAHRAVVALRVIGGAAAHLEDTRAAPVVLGEQVAVALGTEGGQQAGRLDEVERHDRDLP